MSRGRKTSDISNVIDLDRLRRLRKEKGLSFRQVEKGTGIRPGNLCDFEHGRVMLSWPRLSKLLRFYRLDLLEIHDLLHLRLMDARLLRDFRRACARHGFTPEKALRDFMFFFSYEK